jgi:hypothetical protein
MKVLLIKSVSLFRRLFKVVKIDHFKHDMAEIDRKLHEYKSIRLSDK